VLVALEAQSKEASHARPHQNPTATDRAGTDTTETADTADTADTAEKIVNHSTHRNAILDAILSIAKTPSAPFGRSLAIHGGDQKCQQATASASESGSDPPDSILLRRSRIFGTHTLH
jgi:hypothetical protein